MGSFKAYVNELGGLHDCYVQKIIIDLIESVVTIEIDDLYSNFEGLAEYKGCTPAQIVFEKVESLSVAYPYSLIEICGVNDFTVEEETEDGIAIAISFWPSGKFAFSFRKVRITSETGTLWPLD